MNKLSGTFYPFATREQISAIKIASIYFDDVYLLTPISLIKEKEFKQRYQDFQDLLSKLSEKERVDLLVQTVRDPSLRDNAVRTTIDFQEQAKPLIEAGVIKVVNPFDEMRNAGLEHEFQSIIEYRTKQTQKRAEEYHQSNPAHGSLVSVAQVSARFNWFEGLFSINDETLKNIMYDSAVLVSKKFNAIPVTGNYKFVKEFKNQVEESEQGIKTGYAKFAVERERNSYDITTQSILANVPYFDDISFDDIMDLRQHCANELQAFRIETRKLATTITYNNSDKEKSKEILDVVAKEITPIVLELERKISLSRKKWAKNLIDKSTSIETLASLVSTIFMGLPLQYGLLMAAGVAGVQASLETYFETKDIQVSNGLTFLIQLRKKQ